MSDIFKSVNSFSQINHKFIFYKSIFSQILHDRFVYFLQLLFLFNRKIERNLVNLLNQIPQRAFFYKKLQIKFRKS